MSAANREREQWLRKNGWDWDVTNAQVKVSTSHKYWVYGATEIRVPMIYKEVHV